jgi:hypothetical protein
MTGHVWVFKNWVARGRPGLAAIRSRGIALVAPYGVLSDVAGGTLRGPPA